MGAQESQSLLAPDQGDWVWSTVLSNELEPSLLLVPLLESPATIHLATALCWGAEGLVHGSWVLA